MREVLNRATEAGPNESEDDQRALGMQTSAGSLSRRVVRCCAAQSFCDPEVRFLVTPRTRHRKIRSTPLVDLR